MNAKRLGFFSRLLDEASPSERYRMALEQIVHAEQMGLHTAWVAQHHFDGDEGGLPAPFVFLAQAAARTSRIRLGTGIVTLPLDSPIRVAEDAAVLDLMCGGRLELGMGSGGTPSSFAAFGLESAERGTIFAQGLRTVLDAWRGEPLGGSPNRLYPAAPHLVGRVWQATFSVDGGRRAGLAGDGLMLSRTQPRPPDRPRMKLAEMQNPIIDAYLAALPPGVAPRIMGSRSVFIADDREEARRFAEHGLNRYLRRLRAVGRPAVEGTLDELIAYFDSHIGTPDDVAESLAADTTLARATEVAVQVHSIDPPHPFTLRSIELFATRVAPALGWVQSVPQPARVAG
jgi:putative FMN-dependent luciferase-like monooxygenase